MARKLSLLEEVRRRARERMRVWAATGILFAASIGFAFGVGEVLVRMVAPQQLIIARPDFWKPTDGLGWTHHANVNTTINTGERTVRLLTDDMGFRVGRVPRAPAERRVLLLGDSFMEAVQVEYEQSLAGLLEQRLSQRLDQSVTVWNTGVGEWDPNHYLMQANRLLDKTEFDLILVSVYLGNDVVRRRVERFPPRVPTETHAFRFPRDISQGEIIDAWLYPVNDFLERRSHLFVFSKQRFQDVLMRLGLTASYFPEDFLRSVAGAERWEVTAGLLGDIATLGERYAVPVVFVFIPAPFQVDQDVFAQQLRGFDIDPTDVDLEQPNHLLQAALEQRGVHVLDVLAAFRAAHQRGTRLYGTVDRHLSPAGHLLLAELIEPQLEVALGHPGQLPSVRAARERDRPTSGG